MKNLFSNYYAYGAAVLTTVAFSASQALALNEKKVIVIDKHNNALEHSEDGHTAEEAHDALHGTVHHDPHHAEIEGLPQLDFTTYPTQIFWMFVFFIILYIFFAKRTLPEISSSVETRREQVENDLGDAQKLKDEAEEIRSKYEAALHDAKEQASKLFQEIEDDIKSGQSSRLEAFKDRSTKLVQETEARIEKATESAMADTQSIAAEVASVAAEKIVGIPTDLKKAESLVKNIQKKAA